MSLMEKCKSRARQVVIWPGLARDIENLVSRCSVCSKLQVENRKEPLKPHEISDRPWQKVGVDVFELFGRDYSCIVDYYSKFLEICIMKNKTWNTG